MQLFRTIKKSIYDTDFYLAAKTERYSVALKHYTIFILCLAFVIAIPLYVTLGVVSSEIKEAGGIRARVLALYPDELVLDVKDGRVTSNVEEPYMIAAPEEFAGEMNKNLLVISTHSSIVPADFDRYDTLAILGSDALWTRDAGRKKIEIQRFDQLKHEPFVINKEQATEWADMVLRIGKTILTTLLILLPLLIFTALWSGYLLYLIFGACVIWLMAKIRKADLTYGQSYKIGLYLLTLPILYSMLTLIWPLTLLRVPFGFTLIFAAVAYTNLAPKKIIETVSPPSTPDVVNTPEVPKDAEVEPLPEAPAEGNK